MDVAITSATIATTRLGGGVAILFVAVCVALYLTAGENTSIQALRDNQVQLRAYVADHAFLAVLTFMAVFVLYAATSIPGIIALKVIGGLLFSPVPATLIIMVGMTIGGAISFLMVRYVLTDFVRARTGAWPTRLEAGFRRNAWSYMFILRLLPVVPYFAVNIVPALLRVPLRIFLITTFFGTIPNTYIYASLGAGLGDALAAAPGIDPWSALMQPKPTGTDSTEKSSSRMLSVTQTAPISTASSTTESVNSLERNTKAASRAITRMAKISAPAICRAPKVRPWHGPWWAPPRW